MAGETETKTVDLNDPAIKAVVDHRVTTETASLTAERDAAVKERDELQTKLDAEAAAKTAAEQAAEAARTELATERERAQNEQAAASRRDVRKAQLVEKVPHLASNDGAWFNREVAKDGEHVVTCLDRIAAMDDETFTGYVAEIASAFEGVAVPAGGAPASSTTTTPPRETAMAGTTVPSGTPAGGSASAASSFIGRVSYGGGVRR